ncbi:MAG: hypothetical protein WBB29_04755 [Geitlerinemataceae cyanobacterium]
MNVSTSDRYSLTCPICHHAGKIRSGQFARGLYTCPQCQAHLVISHSGHYVRDPLCVHQISPTRVLRRQSRPFARILRDCGLARIAVVAGTVLLGLTWVTIEVVNSPNHPVREVWEDLGDHRLE